MNGGLVVSLDSDKDFRTSLERVLARPEFPTVASAPTEIPHALLLGAIRQNARDWTGPLPEGLA